MGPKCLYKHYKAEGDLHKTEEKAMCPRGRDCNNAATRQGMLAATINSQRQRAASLPEPPEGAQSCRHLGLSPMKLTWDFWPGELKENECVLFKSPSMWYFATTALGN